MKRIQDQTRAAKLAALKKQRRSLSKRSTQPLFNNSTFVELTKKISALEDSFVVYQGRELSAEVVHEMNGSLDVTPYLTHEGWDRIYRAEDGEYYLHRQLDWLDAQGEGRRPASGRTLVHRISITTAALWALMRCCARSRDLRDDVALLLSTRPHPRIYRDRAGVALLSAAVPGDKQEGGN